MHNATALAQTQFTSMQMLLMLLITHELSLLWYLEVFAMNEVDCLNPAAGARRQSRNYILSSFYSQKLQPLESKNIAC